MQITKDTRCCISIAERPGNFGSMLFNNCFKALSMDYIYKPFRLLAGDLPIAIQAIKALGIIGCGVSMPHKIEVIKYLDEVDEVAKKIGAVNTIVNQGGILKGYNTDYSGAFASLSQIFDVRGKKAFILGCGGAARAIVTALKSAGIDEIIITSRDEKRCLIVAKEFELQYNPYAQKERVRANILINATPVGMFKEDESIIGKSSLVNFEGVMDVVISGDETDLIKQARSLGLKFIPGYKMATYQALAQFKLYTGVDVPQEIIENVINLYFK
ncbi:MAG: shikimate dehydrogenase [Candidatus Komeilibacteria bacterium]|nr:shikimate dehydrogenase [Candidatus Komeilibacteria bacterium]